MTTRSWNILGCPVNPYGLLLAASLLGCVAWSYGPSLAGMAHDWFHRPEYSHGFLVPAFALVLLGLRREQLQRVSFQPNAWGLLGIGAGLAVRATGTYIAQEWLETISLLPLLAGLVVLLGSWPALRWTWPSILFLAFMVPLPFRVHYGLSGPLRQLATGVTTYVMQTLGMPALAEGNVILLHGAPPIGVDEACSGLGMLFTFFALATAVAILMRGPLVDRVVVFLSAIPIAVVTNVIRIVVTGLLYVWLNDTALDQWWRETISPKGLAQTFFHDLAGYLMPLLGLGLLWLELKLLGWLLIDPDAPGRRAPAPAAAEAARPRGGPTAAPARAR